MCVRKRFNRAIELTHSLVPMHAFIFDQIRRHGARLLFCNACPGRNTSPIHLKLSLHFVCFKTRNFHFGQRTLAKLSRDFRSLAHFWSYFFHSRCVGVSLGFFRCFNCTDAPLSDVGVHLA
ncbi:hypothetical protein K438DRAFT_234292 [Mycena galopus ATCC 62051]|nr:hypothetical protein K438DRAFT_234292 [Mycena galopus ATCC 62051]